MPSYLQDAAFEHQFWLQIMGDHARFIHSALYPDEEENLKVTSQFITQFDRLLKEARDLNSNNVESLTHEAGELTRQFRTFKLGLLKRMLTDKVFIHLTPTFLNHMVNELEEYLLVLGYFSKGQSPPVFHELHHHMLWLMDASGHAGAINDQMDGVEAVIKQQSAGFVKDFDQFYQKAVELTGYLRSNIAAFPALQRFNEQTAIEMKLFRTFLQELKEMGISKQVLGMFPVLMADHMLREECYYLHKLAQSTHQPHPECDPTRPRVE
ncbi:DUF2935 domain-containing protein [Thalassobacillus sp. CUG 92003]|uniref:DUF2935 domain-containing protein n=1 Tax=Thalassobacillus sp. CUG 92003 TaxID=2736641 RepID=UPI0015E63EA7|nr:DUF2935 domain-containing protein [Thalassobacillus sp. CUG 92003]